MIGTGISKSPSRDTNPFKVKNAKGRSFKTTAPKPKSDGGGGDEVAAVSKRAGKGMKPGPGMKGTTAQPFMERHGKSFKTAVDEWCRGERKDYRA